MGRTLGLVQYAPPTMNPYSPPGPPQPYLEAPPGYGVAPPVAGGVTELAVDLLKQTRPWVMFLSVLAFIGSAFMVIAAVLMMGVGLLASSGPESGVQVAMGVVYLPLAGVYVYPAIKMWMYGSAIGRLLTSRSTSDLEAALLQQKSIWKFSGIAVIVMIVLYFFLFIGIAVWTAATKMGKF